MEAFNFLNSQSKKPEDAKGAHSAGKPAEKSVGVNLMTSEVIREATEKIIRKNAIQLGVSFLIALFIALLFYGGLLVYGTQEQTKAAPLRGKLDSVNAEIVRMESQHAVLIGFQNKLTAVKSLFDNHTSIDQLFTSLENATLPEVSYDTFAYTDDGTIVLTASTTSYTGVGRQLLAFEQTKGFITSVEFSNIASSLNQFGEVIGVMFTVHVKLDPALLKKKPN